MPAVFAFAQRRAHLLAQLLLPAMPSLLVQQRVYVLAPLRTLLHMRILPVRTSERVGPPLAAPPLTQFLTAALQPTTPQSLGPKVGCIMGCMRAPR